MSQTSIQQEQGARLEELIKNLGFDGKSFAKEVNVSQGLVSMMINGKRPISHNLIHEITGSYPDVNLEWLLKGNGTMFEVPMGAKENEVNYTSTPKDIRAKAFTAAEEMLEELYDRTNALDEEVVRLVRMMEKMAEEMKAMQDRLDKLIL